MQWSNSRDDKRLENREARSLETSGKDAPDRCGTLEYATTSRVRFQLHVGDVADEAGGKCGCRGVA